MLGGPGCSMKKVPRIAKILCASLILGSLLVYSPPVDANWQWTTWGMTLDQIIAKSNGGVRTTTEGERESHSVGTKAQPELKVALAYAPYTTGKYEFDAWFLFDPRKKSLVCVYLNLKDKMLGQALRQDLMAKYGRSENSEDFFGKASNWFTEDDRIIWQETAVGYSVEYCSRASSSGL